MKVEKGITKLAEWIDCSSRVAVYIIFCLSNPSIINFLPVKFVHSEFCIFSPCIKTPLGEVYPLTTGVFITLWDIISIHEWTSTIAYISGFTTGISTISGR